MPPLVSSGCYWNHSLELLVACSGVAGFGLVPLRYSQATSFQKENWLIIVTPRFRAFLHDRVVCSWWGFYLLLQNRKSCHVNKGYICVQSCTNFMEYSTSISLEIHPNTCHHIRAYVSQVFSCREIFWLISLGFFFSPVRSRPPCFLYFLSITPF